MARGGHRNLVHPRKVNLLSKKLLGLALLAACTFTAQAADLKPLKVAIDPTYEPFTFKTADGKPTGFDVDMPKPCAPR